MTTVRFELWGPMRVFVDGREASIPAAKHRALLAALLLRAGQSVPVSDLVDRLWDTDPPLKAKAVLQTYVLRARRALGPAADLLRTTTGGYLLAVEPHALDVTEFRELTARAARHAGSKEATAEEACLAQAVALRRGPLLADVPSEVLHREEVPHWEELHLTACERLAELELEQGRLAQSLARLTALSAAHPLRERLWYLRMLALYRGGRQADALRAYRELHRLLDEELAVAPSARLQDLHQAILAGAPELLPPAPEQATTAPPAQDGTSSKTPAFSSWTAACQLPPSPSAFVGRTAALSAISRHLAPSARTEGNVPVLNVCGPPGVGKTALAVTAAHSLSGHYPDGQWYLPLAGATPAPRDPAEVLADLLHLAGYQGPLPQTLEARTAALRGRLTGRRVLLVLDDARDTEQIMPLLPGTAGCAALVTSRRMSTASAGIHDLPLSSLSPDESVELLERLLGRRRVHDEPAACRETVRLCGHLPLALRVAAARLSRRPDASLASFVARLDSPRRRLDELSEDDVGLRTLFDYSYAVMTLGDQRAFRMLGLLPYPHFACWMLGALLGGDGERATERLVAGNLVEPAGTDLAGEPVYRLHDLLAVHARERATLTDGPRDATEVAAAQDRLLDAVVLLATTAYARGARSSDDLPPDDTPVPPVLAGHDVERLLAHPTRWMRANRSHLEALIEDACARGRYPAAARLTDTVLATLGEPGDAPRLLRHYRAVERTAAAAGDERLAWRAAYGRAQSLLYEDAPRARDIFAECVQAFKRLGAQREYLYGLSGLSYCEETLGNTEAQLYHAREAARLADRSFSPNDKGVALRALGAALHTAGQSQEALTVYEEAADIARAQGLAQAEATTLYGLARSAVAVGRLARARSACGRALTLYEEVGSAHGAAWITLMTATVALEDGTPRESASLAARAMVLLRECGDLRGAATAMLRRGEALLADGRPAEARAVLREAVAELDRTGARGHHARAVALLTRVEGETPGASPAQP
ncbi:BTAD domain-containing putative transcriptional regulator [Streptomyces sp. NPDC044780]|uniref:AfsR/SARP family transcriptional regulator n=1 Tax=unclassified Streptomyces TaxID=2593676 RepID=UPI0034009070